MAKKVGKERGADRGGVIALDYPRRVRLAVSLVESTKSALSSRYDRL